MAHLTKLERMLRKERKRNHPDEYKGNRSPMPYRRQENEEVLDEELSHAKIIQSK